MHVDHEIAAAVALMHLGTPSSVTAPNQLFGIRSIAGMSPRQRVYTHRTNRLDRAVFPLFCKNLVRICLARASYRLG
jgi:hypothetical protein